MEVGVRELRNHLSKWIDRVGKGEEVLVTDRGKPVARLTGIAQGAELRLIEAALIALPKEPKRKIRRRGRTKPRGSVSALVKEQRR